MRPKAYGLLLVTVWCLSALAATRSNASTLYSDDFDTNTSANYTLNVSSSDTRVTFAYDYTADGIPASPHGSGGSTRGLKMEANLVAPTATEGLTLSPIGLNVTGDYTITFDMWINANGPFPAGGTGATQFVTAGVGYDGITVNRVLTDGTPATLTGSGAWFAVCGEGGAARDVRAMKNALDVLANAISPNNNVFAAGTTVPGSQGNTDTYYAAAFPAGTAPPALQQSNYAQQTGTLAVGTVGFKWRTVQIAKSGNTVTWRIDGLLIATLTNSVGSAVPLTGRIAIGYMDPFSSVSDNAALSFGLIDNLQVITGGDSDNDGVTESLDNCPLVANADQTEADGDGVGDLCDNCPAVANASQTDSNNDGIGDACPRAAGVDVSHYEGTINWTKVRQAGRVFAFTKASEGLTGPDDTTLATNMTGGRAAGVLMGAYHFAHPENNAAVPEADHFLSFAGAFIAPGYLRPALDLETDRVHTSQNIIYLSNWVNDFMDHVEQLTGVEPIIYTGFEHATSLLNSSVATRTLWMAHRNGQDPQTGSPTTGIFQTWTWWQYTFTGSVPGIAGDADLNVFNGTLAQMQAYVIPTLRYDFDGNGKVDSMDLQQFAACRTGPKIPGPPPSGCTAAQFSAADADGDLDVDSSDFGAFQRCYSGTAVYNLACLNP